MYIIRCRAGLLFIIKIFRRSKFYKFSIQMSLASNPWPASFETSDEVSLLDYQIQQRFYKIFHQGARRTQHEMNNTRPHPPRFRPVRSDQVRKFSENHTLQKILRHLEYHVQHHMTQDGILKHIKMSDAWPQLSVLFNR